MSEDSNTGRLLPFPQNANVAPATDGTDPPDMSDVGTKLARLEEAVAGLRHSQNLTVAATAAVGTLIAAIMIGYGVYSLQRMDSLSDKIGNIPDQVATQNRDIIKTLSEAITATKQQAPQVILLPAPSPPTANAPTPNQNPK